MMIFALVAVPLAVIMQMGGLGASLSAAEANVPGILDWITDIATSQQLTAITIISSLAWGLGYFGQPHSLARFAGIDDHRNIPYSRRIALLWTGLGLVCAILIGIFGHVMAPEGIQGDHERIFIFMVDMLFNPVVASVLLTAILAAVMSTADSQLLICSSTIADDIYKAIFRKQATEKEVHRALPGNAAFIFRKK